MFRAYHSPATPWYQRTMSYMHSDDLTQKEDWLRTLPPLHLFGGCTDRDAERLWRISYDATELPDAQAICTVQDLENMIMDNLFLETGLLSSLEYGLMHRLLSQKGKLLIMHPSEIVACYSFVRRLWCHCEFLPDSSLAVYMPDDLLFAISHTVGNQSFLQHTSQLHDYLQLTDLILLQEGILPLDLALDGMCAFLEDTRTINPNLCIRLLKITYDYAHLDGQTVLIHPGLYDPMPFAGKLPDYPRSIYDIDADAALGFWDAITETAQLLEGLISHSLRKDCYAPDISGDIVLLCRQGAPFEALVDALRSCLVREPTESMLDMLRLLRAQIPAWSALRDAHLFQGGLVC